VLRIRCNNPIGAGVAALAGAALLGNRGCQAAAFFVSEVADWSLEMSAVYEYIVQPAT